MSAPRNCSCCRLAAALCRRRSCAPPRSLRAPLMTHTRAPTWRAFPLQPHCWPTAAAAARWRHHQPTQVGSQGLLAAFILFGGSMGGAHICRLLAEPLPRLSIPSAHDPFPSSKQSPARPSSSLPALPALHLRRCLLPSRCRWILLWSRRCRPSMCPSCPPSCWVCRSQAHLPHLSLRCTGVLCDHPLLQCDMSGQGAQQCWPTLATRLPPVPPTGRPLISAPLAGAGGPRQEEGGGRLRHHPGLRAGRPARPAAGGMGGPPRLAGAPAPQGAGLGFRHLDAGRSAVDAERSAALHADGCAAAGPLLPPKLLLAWCCPCC